MPKKKIIIIAAGVGALLVLGGGGFFAYKKFFAKPAAPVEEGAEAKHGEEKGKEEAKHGEEKGKEGEGKGKEAAPGAANAFMGPTATLNFVVNLSDPGRPRFLKLVMDVELENEKSKNEIEMIKPKARDSIITLLSSKTTEELSTVGDKQKLKNEILHRLNSLMTSGKVREVYFTDFMVQ